MKIKRLFVTAVCLSVFAPGSAQTEQPTIRQFDIPTLQMLGQAIYQQDQEAAKATDALLALHPAADLTQEKVRGWIVDMAPGHDTIRFLRDGDSGLEAAYDINFVGEAPVVTVPQNRSLTDEEKAQFSARMLAARNITRPCSPHYNTVALKDVGGDGWLVWALAATTEPKTYFMGGHYRFTISKDGEKILSSDALSRGCLTMKDNPPPGTKPVAMVSVQLVSNIPVETAVWLNLLSKETLVILTPDRVEWGIIDGKIEKGGTLPDKSAAH